MIACRITGLLAIVLIVCAFSVRGSNAPSTQPTHAYFPMAKGTTWKYRVNQKLNSAADKPFVQTLTVDEPIVADNQVLYPIDVDVYQIKPDGVYLVGRRTAGKITAFPEPQRMLPAKPRSGEAWNATSKSDSAYLTCLGSQTLKTEAGEFLTQCVVSNGGSEAGSQRTAYRYFARDIGLVRETVSVKTKRADGSISLQEVTRDLIAYTAASEVANPTPLTLEPIGTDSLRGELSDVSGQPIAQATLILRRLDKPGARQIQTDTIGRFSVSDLDPAGRYVLASHVIGYESTETPLRSDDRKAIQTELKLKSNSEGDRSSVDAPFTAGKKLAADGNHKTALLKYAEALAVDPKNSTVLAYKSISYLALGQVKDAQQASDEALKLNDKDALVWEVVGQVKVVQNQLNQARAVFDKAAQLSPKNAGAIYMDLAAAFSGRNDNTLAGEIESALKAAAAAEPPSSEALFQLGQGYANAGKQPGATYLRRYIEVAGKLPEAEQDKQKIQVAKQLIRALDALNQAK